MTVVTLMIASVIMLMTTTFLLMPPGIHFANALLPIEMDVAARFKHHHEVGSAEREVPEFLTFVELTSDFGREHDGRYLDHSRGNVCHKSDG